MPVSLDELSPENRRLYLLFGGEDYVPPGVDTTSAVATVPAVPSATATVPEGLSPENERLFKKFSGGEGLADTRKVWQRGWQTSKAVATALPAPIGPLASWSYKPMDWMFQEKTGGIARAQDVLLRDEYALSGGVKTALDKEYFGDTDISWGDVAKEYGRGWTGKNKDMLAEDITTPRYGEPLTALARFLELAADPMQPVGTAFGRSQVEGMEAGSPALAENIEGATGMRLLGLLASTGQTEEGYGRTGTVIPPVAHGAAWGLAASPYTHLRGPGLTRKGRAAKLKQNLKGGPLDELYKAGPEFYGDYLGTRRWDKKAKGWLDKIGEFEQGGAKLPALADPLTNVEQGLYAAIRTGGGDPIWSGRPLYAAAQNLKETIRMKQGWAKTVDSIANAVSTQWRPLYSKELGGQIKPVMTDAEWGTAQAAIRKSVEDSQYAGTSAVEEMLEALKGVSLAKKDDFIRGLDAMYYSGQAPPEIAPVIEALRPWREKIWPQQAQALGADLMGNFYFPHIAAPDKRSVLEKLSDLFKSPVDVSKKREQLAALEKALGPNPSPLTKEGARYHKLAHELGKLGDDVPLAAVDEAVDVGLGAERATKVQPMAEEAMRMLDPDFVKHRRYVGSYLDAARERPELARTHPVLAAAERTRQGAAAEALMGSLDDIAGEFGQRFRTAEEITQAARIVDDVPKGYVMVTTDPWAAPRGGSPYRALTSADEVVMAANSGAPVQMLPVDMVEFTDRFSRTLSSQEMAPILRMYRGYLGHWKVSQLGIYPGYWTRNLVTEHWWNWLRNPEILTPRNWFRAEAVRQGGSGTIDYIHGPMSYDDFRGQVAPRIAHQGMLGAEEVDITKRHVLRTTMEKFTAPAAKGMEKMSGPIEDTPRYMQAIWELENGATIDQAVKAVHDFHINYAELPPFQRKWGKTVAPFSTFPIGATKILARESVRQPHKIAATGRVSRLTELLSGMATDSQPPTPDQIPDYIEAQDPLWLGRPQEYDEEGRPLRRKDNYIPQLNYTPLGMFGEIAGYGSSNDQAMSMMGPLGTLLGMKAGETLTGYTPEGDPYKVAEGRDWFRSRPMLRIPGERTNLGGFSASPKLKSLLLGAVPYGRAYSELERLNPGDVFGSEDERARMWGWDEGGPTFERTGAYRGYPQQDFGTRLMSSLTGLRGYEGDRYQSWLGKQKERDRLIREYEWKLKDENLSVDDRKYYYDLLQGVLKAQRGEHNK